jgi:drug/metabolite transporter (DMT)-like permease
MTQESNASAWLSPNPALPPGDIRLEPRPVAGTLAAVGAALLFGGAGPIAKGFLPPGGAEIALAATLYLFAGVGLAALVALLRAGRWARPDPRPLVRSEKTALAWSTLCGGFLAPILLMFGLARASGTAASLLLAAEMPMTALAAILFLRERLDRTTTLGAGAILAGSLLVALGARSTGDTTPLGALCILGCSAVWAADTSVTSRLAGRDPLVIAAWKCLLATPATLALATLVDGTTGFVALADPARLPGLAATGLFGYGLSISLFVLAIRWIGVARTGALFGTSPLLGAGVAVVWLGETPSLRLFLAAGCMALGAGVILLQTLKTRSPAPTR